MAKMIRIESCMVCPAYSFKFEQCKMKDKEWTSYTLLPDWCPLEDTPENELQTLRELVGKKEEWEKRDLKMIEILTEELNKKKKEIHELRTKIAELEKGLSEKEEEK